MPETKSEINLLNSSGLSMFIICPAPFMETLTEPEISFSIMSAISLHDSKSYSAVTMRVGSFISVNLDMAGGLREVIGLLFKRLQ